MRKKLILSDHTLKKFIKEVKKRECLWNPEHESYNDRYRMAKAWLEISDLMNLPEDRLRIRWKNLRDLFKKEIKKYGAEQYKGRWRHYEEMKFLTKVMEESRVEEQDEDQASNEDESDGNKVTPKEELTDDEVEYVGDQENGAAASHQAEVYFEPGYEENPIPEKMAKLDDEDYEVMFLKSLAPYLRQLDPLRKLVVRSKMQDMLLNEIAAQASANQFHLKQS